MFRRRVVTVDRDSTFTVEKVTATRAIFISEDVQEVEIKLTLEGGLVITLQVPARQAANLLNEVGVAYQAIMPPPITGLTQWGARSEMWQ